MKAIGAKRRPLAGPDLLLGHVRRAGARFGGAEGAGLLGVGSRDVLGVCCVPQAELLVSGSIGVPVGGGHDHVGQPGAAEDEGSQRVAAHDGQWGWLTVGGSRSVRYRGEVSEFWAVLFYPGCVKCGDDDWGEPFGMSRD